jgi:hypothetical protein
VESLFGYNRGGRVALHSALVRCLTPEKGDAIVNPQN